MDYIELDSNKLKELTKLYKEAVAAGKNTIVYEGKLLDTTYTSYLIEYAENAYKQAREVFSVLVEGLTAIKEYVPDLYAYIEKHTTYPETEDETEVDKAELVALAQIIQEALWDYLKN
jgi:hypothetical protein